MSDRIEQLVKQALGRPYEPGPADAGAELGWAVDRAIARNERNLAELRAINTCYDQMCANMQACIDRILADRERWGLPPIVWNGAAWVRADGLSGDHDAPLRGNTR